MSTCDSTRSERSFSARSLQAEPGSEAEARQPEWPTLYEDVLAAVRQAPPGRLEDIPRGETRIGLLRRATELLIAGSALLAAAPLLLIIAALIKRGTPGPVLFRQERLGLNGERFTFLKFRTMYVDAAERFPEYYDYRLREDEITRFQFKDANDPRVTPMGRWLRRTSLDELPNLWHVITGDLRLVGPRPQIPELLPYYRGLMLERFSVRPGLTDLAHVSGRSDLSFCETTALDVEYVRNRSLRLDAKILFKTAVTVLHGDGAY